MPDSYSSLATDESLRRALRDACSLADVEFLRSTDSTQRRAREIAADDGPDWSLVATDHQSAGRGQHGRTWSAAPECSVLFSLVVRPASAEAMTLIPIRVGLAVAESLDEMLGTDRRIRLKWPNDLIVDGAKLGGILCEGTVRGSELRAIVGVGINVHRFDVPADAETTPAFLDDVAGRDVDRLEVLRAAASAIRTSLDLAAPRLTPAELAHYARRDSLAEHLITEPIAGTVLGINAEGHLMVRTETTVEAVVAGRAR